MLRKCMEQDDVVSRRYNGDMKFRIATDDLVIIALLKRKAKFVVHACEDFFVSIRCPFGR